MRQTLVLAALAAALLAGEARAQGCSTTQYPYPLTNGSAADASQVTYDLNCAAVYGLAHWPGYVGIGTTTPIRILHTYSGQGSNEWLQELGGVVANGGKWNWVVDGGSSTQPTEYYLRRLNDAGTGGSQPFLLITGGANPNQVILQPNGGNVGIGTTSPTATLYVNGSTVLTQGYTTSSDARLKTDVTPITGALATVERLEGVHYRWLPAGERPIGKTLNLPVDQPQIGFLAQAVQKVVPEAVTAPKTADDIYTLDPSKLIPILVEAIKEQQAEIADLKAQVHALTSK